MSESAKIDYLMDHIAREGLHTPRSASDECAFEEGRVMRRMGAYPPAYCDGWRDVMVAGGHTYEDRQISWRRYLEGIK